MIAWVLASILALLPTANPYAALELAEAITEAAETREEAAILISLAWWESGRSFDCERVGDAGHSVSCFQLWACPGPLCRILQEDARMAAIVALAWAKGSIRRCRYLGESNALAEYTTGRCQPNREARQRWATAARLMREAAP